MGSINNDSSDLNRYTELGWELYSCRLQLIDLCQLGQLEKNDVTVVTHRDRFFLYDKMFPVIDFSDFVKSNIPNEDVVDLVAGMAGFIDRNQWKPFYKNFDRDRELILNFNYSNISGKFTVDKPFVCILARFREHAAGRNVSGDYLNKVINFLKDKGIAVFVFGKMAEESLQNKNATYVNINEACYLMSQEQCKFLFGSMSGGTHLGLFCHKKQMLILDTSCFSKEKGVEYNPLFMGKAANFTNVPIEFFYSNPHENVLIEFIK
jgi:hypothetical protein